jgi:hypothetical protein
MEVNAVRTPYAVRRFAMGAIASLGLSLLGLGAARAADVTVQPAPGAGFVVTDNTGASQRFKVVESGPIFLGGLVGSPLTENQALCYDTTTGQVGPCPSAKNLAFCVPNAAAAPRYVDNGDGTLTDRATCLMWEMKTGTAGPIVDCSTTTCSNPHDVNNGYKWSASGSAPDGVLFTDFLPRVNGQLCASSTCPGLGGHSDWRVPTLSELLTIVDAMQGFCGGGSGPCINPAFGPTVAFVYWSSATLAGFPTFAWGVNSNGGGSSAFGKASIIDVRAVRGGL